MLSCCLGYASTVNTSDPTAESSGIRTNLPPVRSPRNWHAAKNGDKKLIRSWLANTPTDEEEGVSDVSQ